MARKSLFAEDQRQIYVLFCAEPNSECFIGTSHTIENPKLSGMTRDEILSALGGMKALKFLVDVVEEKTQDLSQPTLMRKCIILEYSDNFGFLRNFLPQNVVSDLEVFEASSDSSDVEQRNDVAEKEQSSRKGRSEGHIMLAVPEENQWEDPQRNKWASLRKTMENDGYPDLTNSESGESQPDNSMLQKTVGNLQKEVKELKDRLLRKEEECDDLRNRLEEMANRPENLIFDTKETLSKAQDILRMCTTLPREPVQIVHAASAARQGPIVKLHHDFEFTIAKHDLEGAISAGLGGQQTASLRAMMNKIMEATYSRPFMASHSLSGKVPPGKKSGTSPVKPALPREDVLALTKFAQDFWKKQYDLNLPVETVHNSISRKLWTEHREHRDAGKKLRNQNLDGSSSAHAAAVPVESRAQSTPTTPVGRYVSMEPAASLSEINSPSPSIDEGRCLTTPRPRAARQRSTPKSGTEELTLSRRSSPAAPPLSKAHSMGYRPLRVSGTPEDIRSKKARRNN